MRSILFIIFLTIFLVGTPVLAGDVSLKTTQSEYTFSAGEEARIPIIVESTFPSTNVGTLAYTLTRKEAQGGVFILSVEHTIPVFSDQSGKFTKCNNSQFRGFG